MGNSMHHGELLVWIGKKIEKRLNVLKGGDSIVLPSSNQHGTFDLARIEQRQPLAHIDIGPVWHGVIEGTDCSGIRPDHTGIGSARVVPGKDRFNELLINGTAGFRAYTGEALATFGEGGTTFTRPDKRIQDQSLGAPGVALGE